VTQVPVFINCRDRLTPLLALLDYLERAGCEQIYLLDNGSTYPPLLEYYEQSPHTVIRFGENRHRKSLWRDGLLDELGVRGPYVFSDPDTVPIEECPLDAIDYFAEVLDRYPGYKKVGFGLRIDDLPDHFRLKAEVIAWESRFWQRLIAPRLYEAPIDTTFALYRDPEHAPRAAIRTGYPYLVRHTTWYLDSADPPEEHRYYTEHARVTSWSRDGMAGGPDGPNPARWRKMTKKLEEFAALPDAPAAVKATPERAHNAAVAGSAWNEEPSPVAEATYSPTAGPGWQAWNDHSPEVEFCDFVGTLVQLTEPATVIETGTGQGFVTRRMKEHMGPEQRLLCFESSPEWRQALQALPDFDGETCALSEKETPDDADFSTATLSVLDSRFRHRFDEVTAWWRAAPPGALVVIHDTGNEHSADTGHARLGALIRELGIPGVFLKNPRGGFLGFKPESS
jgi:hypothetical protein